jgi:hypothetical protein
VAGVHGGRCVDTKTLKNRLLLLAKKRLHRAEFDELASEIQSPFFGFPWEWQFLGLIFDGVRGRNLIDYAVKGITAYDKALVTLVDDWVAEKHQGRAMTLPPRLPARPAPVLTLQRPTITAAPSKPLSRFAAQDAAILVEIKKLGLDPLALPKNPAGKPGVKAAVRSALSESKLFKGSKVFDKAWERLAAHADIVIQR